jgi:hypothetical protein
MKWKDIEPSKRESFLLLAVILLVTGFVVTLPDVWPTVVAAVTPAPSPAPAVVAKSAASYDLVHLETRKKSPAVQAAIHQAGTSLHFGKPNENLVVAIPPPDGIRVPLPAAPKATVTIGGTARELEADSLGLYPRMHVEAKSAIAVALGVDPNEALEVLAADGGVLNGKYSDVLAKGGAQGSAQFGFETNSGPGSYRVVINRGGTRSVLDFWVGPDLPPRVQTASN